MVSKASVGNSASMPSPAKRSRGKPFRRASEGPRSNALRVPSARSAAGPASRPVVTGERAVDVVPEIPEMIEAQRGYELNSRVMAAADEMMSAATRIR